MSSIKRFEDILAWKKARQLVKEIYLTCSTGEFYKDFDLKDQIRRAAVSSMTNVAEGFGRKTNKDFAHFLDLARGRPSKCNRYFMWLAISNMLIYQSFKGSMA